jgi:ribosomal protein S18 acetylase RimI-like enzyme
MNVLVAESETGEVVGTVAWVRESEALAHIRGMAVDPSRQGRGLARSLLAAALDEIRAAGVRRVTLDTTPPLRRAMRFYERNGFRRSGRVSDFFGMRLIEYDRTLGRRRK